MRAAKLIEKLKAACSKIGQNPLVAIDGHGTADEVHVVGRSILITGEAVSNQGEPAEDTSKDPPSS